MDEECCVQTGLLPEGGAVEGNSSAELGPVTQARFYYQAAGPGNVLRLFFIFIFKKLKISKIYGRSKKFQKWAPVAHGEGDRPPVAQAGGDMPFL